MRPQGKRRGCVTAPQMLQEASVLELAVVHLWESRECRYEYLSVFVREERVLEPSVAVPPEFYYTIVKWRQLHKNCW